MASKDEASLRTPEAGRKAAYFARNRASLILATQEVLGQKGWSVSVEEIAGHAQMSPSTVYKHFENRELLLQTAVSDAMNNWEAWVSETLADITDPLELLVKPMRLLCRIRSTHPRYAAMMSKIAYQAQGAFPEVTNNLRNHIKELVKAGLLKIDHVEGRTNNLVAVLGGAFAHQLTNDKSKPAEADLALQLELPSIGISPAKAKALMTKSLPIDTSKPVI